MLSWSEIYYDFKIEFVEKKAKKHAFFSCKNGGGYDKMKWKRKERRNSVQKFKRTPLNFLKNFIYAVVTPVFVYFLVYIVGGFLTENMSLLHYIGIGLGALAGIFLLYSVVFSENIFVEVDDKELRYYKRGKLKTSYSFEHCQFGYYTVSSSGTTDRIELKILHMENGMEERLDLQPLGSRQFHKLFEILEVNQVGETQKLEVQKKQ